MIEVNRTQSLTDFRKNPSETLNQLRETGDVELLVEDGQRQVVVMSPEAFDALAADIEYVQHLQRIQRSVQELAQGKGIEVNEAFAKMRERLQKEFSEQENGRD